MTTDRFTQEQFEATLPAVSFTTQRVKGELVYYIPVYFVRDDGNLPTNKRIVVRSSIDSTGHAADSGQDSIRHWVEYHFENGLPGGLWKPLAKAGKAWTTRVPGWGTRLTEALKELWQIALDDSAKHMKKGVSGNGSVRSTARLGISAVEAGRDVAYSKPASKDSDSVQVPSGATSNDKHAGGDGTPGTDLQEVLGDSGSTPEPAAQTTLDDDTGRNEQGATGLGRNIQTDKLSPLLSFLGEPSANQIPVDDDRRDAGSNDTGAIGPDDNSTVAGTGQQPADVRATAVAPLIKLNPHQQAVVDALAKGPQVVEAAPGSGKTRTLENLVAALILSGADPSRIGVFTFSNPAASEARYRIARTLWPDLSEDKLKFFADPFENKETVSETWIDADPARRMIVDWICTIHAMSLRLLKKMGEKVNVLSGRQQWDANAIIKDALSEMRWNEAAESVKVYISAATLNLIAPAQAQQFYSEMLAGTDVAWRARDLAEIYRRYVDFCRVRKLVDFDMMQARVLKNLRYDPQWRKAAQELFDYILVDEAQDTDGLQAEILWTLAAKTGNILFCGDVDQSMYAFRGSKPSVLREDFLQKWPNVRRFDLPVNYRSTKSIIARATQLIGFNYEGPEDPYLKAFDAREDAPDGVDLSYIETESFAGLCEEVAALVIDNPSDWYVLSRTRAECAAIHTELVRQGIPAVNKSGGMLFGSPHVRKALAYAMLACDHDEARNNMEILSEVANVASIDFRAPFTKKRHLPTCNKKDWEPCGCPTIMVEGQDHMTARYYGTEAVQAARNWNGVIAQQYEKNRGGYPTTRAKGAQDFVQFVERIEKLRDDARACLNLIISDCIQPWLEAEYGDDGDLAENGKVEDLNLLLSLAKPDQTMEQYLREIDRLSKGGSGKGDDESVILGTAHWSKGSESRKVVCNITRLPIIAPKHKPGRLPVGRPATIEEERRLLYVMVTRAKEECYVVASQEWNGQPMQRSRFVEELGLLDGQAEYGEEGEDNDTD